MKIEAFFNYYDISGDGTVQMAETPKIWYNYLSEKRGWHKTAAVKFIEDFSNMVAQASDGELEEIGRSVDTELIRTYLFNKYEAYLRPFDIGGPPKFTKGYYGDDNKSFDLNEVKKAGGIEVIAKVIQQRFAAHDKKLVRYAELVDDTWWGVKKANDTLIKAAEPGGTARIQLPHP